MKVDTNKNTRISTIKKKQIFLKSLNKNLGVIEPALKDANIHRQTYINWKNKDPKFKQGCKDVEKSAVEFVESKLYENIAAGKETSIIFYLKCRGVDEDGNKRYIDRQYVEQNTTFTEPLRLNVIQPQLPPVDDKKQIDKT